jgi:hypothetical protein
VDTLAWPSHSWTLGDVCLIFRSIGGRRGAQGMHAYSEMYPDISQDEAGMRRLFKQFSLNSNNDDLSVRLTLGETPDASGASRNGTW